MGIGRDAGGQFGSNSTLKETTVIGRLKACISRRSFSVGAEQHQTQSRRTHLAVRSNGPWKGSWFMPLTRGEAVGYDADLMAFKFTMRNGQQIVQCEISRAALVDLAGRSTGGAARDLPAQFEAHRELIEAIASAEFDRISNEETRLVRIFAKHIPSNPTQK